MDSNKLIKYTFIFLSGIITFVFLSRILKNATSSEIDGLKVILTAKVIKDDVFQLFYWEKAEKSFKIKNSVKTKVVGEDKFQDIIFELPTLTDLFRLRLDIGENSKQQKVVIDKIEFNSQDGEIPFNVSEFDKLFAPNRFIEIMGKGEYRGISGTSGKKSFYDPYFISIDGSNEMGLIKNKWPAPYPYLAAILASLILILFMFKNQEKIAISAKGAFVSIFMLILVLPTLQQNIGFAKELENIEKRKLAQKPEFSFSKKFARDFESYFDDHFGFRNRLVSWGGSYKTKLFRSSKNPDLTMFGKDKWLFYTRRVGNSRMYKSYTRTNLLSNDSLKLLANQWEERKKKYEADSIKYSLVFWPNKHSIYPEKMSLIMKTQIKDTVSRVDQIMNYLQKTKSPVKLTDVRSRTIQEKSRNQVYHKFDSHWNDFGAYIGYHDFFNQNLDYLGIIPKNLQDFDVTWSDYYGGELIQLLGVRNDGFFKEQRPRFDLKNNENRIEFLSTEGLPRLTVRTRNMFAGNKLKALIFRDSFTNSLEQFFSLHFYEVTYIWTEHREYYVHKFRPDIIIDGYVEREIGNKIK